MYLYRCAFFRLSRLNRLQRAPATLVPNEREIKVELGWDCSRVKQFKYNAGGAHLYHTLTTPPGHPFAREIWAGTCEVGHMGQLTPGGFHDSKTQALSECSCQRTLTFLKDHLGGVSRSLVWALRSSNTSRPPTQSLKKNVSACPLVQRELDRDP